MGPIGAPSQSLVGEVKQLFEILSDSKSVKKYIDQMAELLDQQKAETEKQSDYFAQIKQEKSNLEALIAKQDEQLIRINKNIDEANKIAKSAEARLKAADEKEAYVLSLEADLNKKIERLNKEIAQKLSDADEALANAKSMEADAKELKEDLESKLNKLKSAMVD